MKYSSNHDSDRKVNIHNPRRWSLAMYDGALMVFSAILLLGFNPGYKGRADISDALIHLCLLSFCVYSCRVFLNIYKQIWRYGGAGAYMRLMLADLLAGCIYYLLQTLLPVCSADFLRSVFLVSFNLLLSICIRLTYQYLYDSARRQSNPTGLVWKIVAVLTGLTFEVDAAATEKLRGRGNARIAIVGAGRIGVMLAEELLNNAHSEYTPCCFVDTDFTKAGREVYGLPVFPSDETTLERLQALQVQEIVFALPNTTAARKVELFDYYSRTGCKMKVYDYPIMHKAESGKRYVRAFDIEELLFRDPIELHSETTSLYYAGKTVLITGGGGSIGSELCRQIASMRPRRLVILDVYENNAYKLQCELNMSYGNQLDVQVEIVSICDRKGLESVFRRHRPDIVLHAAAHKHVPLMERNCCEAVKNNVFGTKNVLDASEKFCVSRFIMISTDKAVNPTNVMGATKRMCEMLVQSYSGRNTGTTYSTTRFGNVLGSHGSVIPLFKRQIMQGGPVTVTDCRIVRYFMTIPEASQLVLESGALAKNGELFVLDMGKPVKILDLAETMIRLSGYEPHKDIRIVETGLRPGEKLYEELLVRKDKLTKTKNDSIFIEKVQPVSYSEICKKLDVLSSAVETEDDETVRAALARVVPTYSAPESVNGRAAHADEMKIAFETMPGRRPRKMEYKKPLV